MAIERDISNNVVAILLVLTLAVSALGTWALVTTLKPDIDPRGSVSPSSDSQVLLRIGGDPRIQHRAGNVELRIAPKEEL